MSPAGDLVPRPGSKLGPYDIVAPLGAGGRTTPWTEIRAAETAGLRRSGVHSTSRLLTDLYSAVGVS
jgi:hypothetical protein